MNAPGAEMIVASAANTVDGEILAQIGGRTYPPGTIIFPKVGGALLTNKKRILGVEAAFDNNVMGVVPRRVDGDWLYHWILGYDLRQLANTQALPSIRQSDVADLEIDLPPPPEQRRTAARLREQMAAVAEARAAVKAQDEALDILVYAVLRESLADGSAGPARFGDCLREVTEGIGEDWRSYRVLGATRNGLALAKEPVGKNPGRYKPVRPGTVFYNPMRILLGSIAMLEEGDAPGITSPDYVVMTAVEGRLNASWFYHWFRSRYGAEFIRSMTRGAVRERLMFRRLAPASFAVPDFQHQQAAAARFAAIEKTKAKLAEELEALDLVPAALLREAFAGRI